MTGRWRDVALVADDRGIAPLTLHTAALRPLPLY